MNSFCSMAKSISNAEDLAALYLQRYDKERGIEYPINPFQMLVDEGVSFAIRDFGKLEGVFIPATDSEDIPIVGININRPITRQRFTAAHELCHFFRDTERQICPIGNKTAAEKFADRFASAVLMPSSELNKQVDIRKKNGYVDFDGILEIANYFGVSFESCVFRIAYDIHAVQGNTEINELKKRIKNYKPDFQRKSRGYNNVLLYEGLIDSYGYALRFKPNDFAVNVFQNNYIYNDSRMEGVEIDIETAAEIVTDIRLSKQGSQYCNEGNEAFLSIAGHSAMYSYIFEISLSEKCSVFDTLSIHSKLYSCFPYPDFGGKLRDSNTLVLGTKFETVDFKDIVSEMIKIEEAVKKMHEKRKETKISEYIKEAVRIHHRLTVVHTLGDGNGSTWRAFYNAMMIGNNLTPVYIKVEDKDEYLKALSVADEEGEYVLLFECFYRSILRTNVELTR